MCSKNLPRHYWIQLPNGRVYQDVVKAEPSLQTACNLHSEAFKYPTGRRYQYACETRQFEARISKFLDLSLRHIPLMHERQVGLMRPLFLIGHPYLSGTWLGVKSIHMLSRDWTLCSYIYRHHSKVRSLTQVGGSM